MKWEISDLSNSIIKMVPLQMIGYKRILYIHSWIKMRTKVDLFLC